MTTSGQQNLFAAGETDDPMTETKEKATPKKTRGKSVVNAETMAKKQREIVSFLFHGATAHAPLGPPAPSHRRVTHSAVSGCIEM